MDVFRVIVWIATFVAITILLPVLIPGITIGLICVKFFLAITLGYVVSRILLTPVLRKYVASQNRN
jgi:multidrug efflux pump subunit AcrB